MSTIEAHVNVSSVSAAVRFGVGGGFRAGDVWSVADAAAALAATLYGEQVIYLIDEARLAHVVAGVVRRLYDAGDVPAAATAGDVAAEAPYGERVAAVAADGDRLYRYDGAAARALYDIGDVPAFADLAAVEAATLYNRKVAYDTAAALLRQQVGGLGLPLHLGGDVPAFASTAAMEASFAAGYLASPYIGQIGGEIYQIQSGVAVALGITAYTSVSTLWDSAGSTGDLAILTTAGGTLLARFVYVFGQWHPCGPISFVGTGASTAWGGLALTSGSPTWGADGITVPTGSYCDVYLIKTAIDVRDGLVSSGLHVMAGLDATVTWTTADWVFFGSLSSTTTTQFGGQAQSAGGGYCFGLKTSPSSASTGGSGATSPATVRSVAAVTADANFGNGSGGTKQVASAKAGVTFAQMSGGLASSRPSACRGIWLRTNGTDASSLVTGGEWNYRAYA